MKYALIMLLCVSMFFFGCEKEQKPVEKPTTTETPVITAPKVETPTIEAPKAETMTKPVIPTAPIPGGYQKQDPLSADIQSIAKDAVILMQKENANLVFVKVHEAATQVVAGTNYFLRIEFKEKDSTVLYDIILYETLPPAKEKSLTRFEKLK